MPISHVQRTIALLVDDRGYDRQLIGRTESFNSFTFQRVDLFSIFDYVAVSPGRVIQGIQICGADFREHVRKIEKSYVFRHWLDADSEILLIGWRKVVLKRGGKAMRWRARTMNWYRHNVWLDDGIKRDENGKLI